MNDKELIALLKEDPEQGMEQIVTQYTGLLCMTAARKLSDPEDVKDCVNETFVEFFRQRGLFNPEKGSLKSYLAVIAGRQAMKRYHENRRFQTLVADRMDDTDVFADFERKEELEAYLQQLDPLDEQILRMKYYGGMTGREIAEALGLPYETVKKRHQRSLKKLRKALTIGLIVVALLAILSACAYVVLRYFGIVPGYGINTDPSGGVYVLEDAGIVVQNEDFEATITDVWWMNGILTIDSRFICKDDSVAPGMHDQRTGESRFTALTVEGLEEPEEVIGIWSEEMQQEYYRLVYQGTLPEDAEETLTIDLRWDNDTACTVTLKRAETEVSFEKAGYYEMTEDQGGLLAMPRLENGELIVAIYALSEGDYVIQPLLTAGSWAGYDPDAQDLTVTAADGTVMTGHRVSQNGFSSNSYYEWNFGPAEPGSYTLNVPYVYQSPAEGVAEELLRETIRLKAEGGELDAVFAVPDGEIRLTRMEVTEHDNRLSAETEEAKAINEHYSRFTWWNIDSEFMSHDPERTIVGASFSMENPPENYVRVEAGEATLGLSKVEIKLRSEPVSGSSAMRLVGLLAGSYDGETELELQLMPRYICYRWNHAFQIDFEVSKTE